MIGFVQPGYLNLTDAIQRALEAWFPGEAKATLVSDAEAALLQAHLEAEAEVRTWSGVSLPARNKTVQLSLVTAEILSIKNRQRERAALHQRAWTRLRGALSTGDLPGYGVIQGIGTEPVPAKIWHVLEIDTPPESIPVVFGGIRVQVWPRIREEDLSRILSGGRDSATPQQDRGRGRNQPMKHPFSDADWSPDQALIWMATRRADLVNEASDDPFVPAEKRLRWVSFLLRDDAGEVSREEIEQQLLQAIKRGGVSTTVDGEPVDPRVYSPARYVMGPDGVLFRWTDQVPFLTNILEGDARHERRHQRELRPRLEITDLVRLYPNSAAAAPKTVATEGEAAGPVRSFSLKRKKRKIGDIKAVADQRKAMRAVWSAATGALKEEAIAAAREGRGISGNIAAEVGTKKKAAGGKRGPKPKYEWDQIRREALRLLDHYGGVSIDEPELDSQEALVRRLLSFSEDRWSRAPSESTMRERVSVWIAEYNSGSRK